MTSKCRNGDHPLDASTLAAGGEVCFECSTKPAKRPRKLTPRQTERLIKDEVERVYRAHCTGDGKIIRVLDIGKVFAAGASVAAGVVPFDPTVAHDAMVAAMVAKFEEVRVKS